MKARGPDHRAAAAEFADDVLDLVGAMPPAKRAGLVATMLVSGAMGRARAPFLLSVATGVAAGFAAERAYAVIHDVHAAALSSLERDELTNETLRAALGRFDVPDPVDSGASPV